jgi:spermidine synthase
VIPPDDARFSVVQADGARFVAQTPDRYEVLMVDAFDANGMPQALGTRRFYDDCLDVLEPGGVLAVNLHAGHPLVEVYIDRVRQSFAASVVRVDDSDGGNCVILAVKPGLGWTWGAAAARRPDGLAADAWNQLQGAFARIAAAAHALRHDAERGVHW